MRLPSSITTLTTLTAVALLCTQVYGISNASQQHALQGIEDDSQTLSTKSVLLQLRQRIQSLSQITPPPPPPPKQGKGQPLSQITPPPPQPPQPRQEQGILQGLSLQAQATQSTPTQRPPEALQALKQVALPSGQQGGQKEGPGIPNPTPALQQELLKEKQAGLPGGVQGGLKGGGPEASLSDRYFKHFLQPLNDLHLQIPNMVGSMSSLPLHSWQWRSSTTSLFGVSGASKGFIAQQVADIAPQYIQSRSYGLTVNYEQLFQDAKHYNDPHMVELIEDHIALEQNICVQ